MKGNMGIIAIIASISIVVGLVFFIGNFSYIESISGNDYDVPPTTDIVVDPSVTEVIPNTSLSSPETSTVNPEKLVVTPLSITNDFVLPLGQQAFAIPSTQNTVTYTEWPLPTSFAAPFGSATDSANIIYFGQLNSIRLGKLDPATNSLTEWPLPAGGQDIWGIAVDSSGSPAYYARPTESKIGRVDLSTNVVEEWSLPFYNPRYVATDPAGNIYTAGCSANKIARLDPTTNTLTEWSVPFAPCPLNLTLDSSNNLWFTIFAGANGGIGKLDLLSNSVTVWPITTTNARPEGIALDSAGNIFFLETQGPRNIGRLNPNTNVMTEWTSGIQFTARSIAVDSSDIVYVEASTLVIRLDPSTNVRTEWSLPASGQGSGLISVDSLDNVYFGASSGNTVVKLS